MFYYSPALGELRLEAPATVRGGILADESSLTFAYVYLLLTTHKHVNLRSHPISSAVGLGKTIQVTQSCKDWDAAAFTRRILLSWVTNYTFAYTVLARTSRKNKPCFLFKNVQPITTDRSSNPRR